MRILITNDDGVTSPGLFALKRALDRVGETIVVAPDRNRSAIARSITIDRPLTVEEVTLPDGTVAFATDGTPVDCVRLAVLGLVGDAPDLIVSGVNLGLNVGDDVTYSGTVAAALEGVLLGWPAIAVSQAPIGVPDDRRDGRNYDFSAVSVFVAGIAARAVAERLPRNVILNVNAPGLPASELAGVRVTRLGRRIYRDRLELTDGEGPRRRYRIYGDAHGNDGGAGTDAVAVEDGYISVTPLHFDLTDIDSMSALERWDLRALHLDDASAA
ncbi:MAG: 5'/3'-nucleotidase SurE [Actinobacteria bacterium]|nr:5'/3'-nucleotidase SurE [Actinomycetota bacterium]